MEAIAPVLSLPFYLPGEAPLPKAMDALDALAGGSVSCRRHAGTGPGRRASGPAGRAGRAPCGPAAGAGRYRRCAPPARLWVRQPVRQHADPHRPAQRLVRGDGLQLSGPGALGTLGRHARRAAGHRRSRPAAGAGRAGRSRLWQALPQVAQGRVHQLPRMNAFGGVPAALRFGDLLADALDA